MDYLARESADLSIELWNDIDELVMGTLRQHLVGRQFLTVAGPFGPGTTSVRNDSVDKEETMKDGIARIKGRSQLEMPLFYEDFFLLGRDLEYADQTGQELDLTPAIRAAKAAAIREDELIMLGSEALGTKGLYTAKGVFKVKKGDWNKSEVGYTDVAKAVTHFVEGGYLGRYALILSPDLYLALQHLVPNTGLLEIDRIKKLIGDKVYTYSGFGKNKAVLVCAEPEYLDLAVGLDFSVGYAELVDFNHHFRVMETAALRIKDSGAIAVFE